MEPGRLVMCVLRQALGDHWPSELIRLIVNLYVQRLSRLYCRANDILLVTGGVVAQSFVRWSKSVVVDDRWVRDLVGDVEVCQIGVNKGQMFYVDSDHHQLVGHPVLAGRTCQYLSHDHLGGSYALLNLDGSLETWGDAIKPQLGRLATWGNYAKASSVGGVSNVLKVAVGEHHMVALTRDGQRYVGHQSKGSAWPRWSGCLGRCLVT